MRAWFHPEAEAEHLKQIAYYEAQQPGLGARYLAEVTAALECRPPAKPKKFVGVQRISVAL